MTMNATMAETERGRLSSNLIRQEVLNVAAASKVGHIGSALSVVDILTVLYRDILQGQFPESPTRDRFVLSKGHAALALYVIFHQLGWISRELLNSYCLPDGQLGVHPDHHLSGVEFSTGSLGMGPSFAAGSALAAKLKGETWRIYVLCSDAELNCGAFWEAIQFAGHHCLGNLTLILDANGQQALGRTREIIDLEPIEAHFRQHRWLTAEVDGHDEPALTRALNTDPGQGKPLAIIARTIAGKGVSFMEGSVDWHYLPLSPAQHQQALAELEL